MNSVALRLIDEAYEKKSSFLDLGNCGLTEIPREIVKLSETLVSLNLGSWYRFNTEWTKSANTLMPNFIKAVSSFTLLAELNNLGELALVENSIGDKGAEYISRLTGLTNLNLSRNGIGERGAAYISRLTGLTKLNLSGNGIDDIGAESISCLTGLTNLDLNSNDIGGKGAEYISRLTGLITLDLGFNNIVDKGAEYISRIAGLTTLDLDFSNIGDKGAEYISRITGLTTLDLANNNIGDKGAEYISRITGLTTLGLANNNIGEKGAEYISRMTGLNTLDLSANNIGEKGAEYISRITGLTNLYLSNNVIGDTGARHISRMTGLTKLDLGNNNIREKGVEYISRIAGLTNLYLYNNSIGDKGAEYVSRITGLSHLNLNNNLIRYIGAEYISQISGLITLNLGKNVIGDTGAKHIRRMSCLTNLNLSNNLIGEEGANYISQIIGLMGLDLSDNGIGDKGAEYISRLTGLTNLDLSNNNISYFAPNTDNKLKTLHLLGNTIISIPLKLVKNTNLDIDVIEDKAYFYGKIFLHGNPIKTPPREVLEKGRDAILEYLEGDLRPLNECKLIFVGDGSVGKTSLMKRLVYKTFDEKEQTTHGINKISWQGFTNEYGEPVKINLWDFGGQHIQHSLHQFFFTARVVYVLVLNPRNDQKAGYWLDQIDKLGSNSQLIIVYNWKDVKDNEADFLGNFRELQKTYKYLPEPITLSCKEGEGMDEFEKEVRRLVLLNEGLKIKYPKTWFNIKEKLETGIPIEKHYIEYAQYEIWCEEEQYNDPERRRNLLKILDSVGSIVFFDKPVLNELQVLNPEWISTGAYAIITSEKTKENKGHLSWNDLCEIFKSEKEIFSDKNIKISYKEKHFQFILELMLEYRLCQKDPFNEHQYLIPSAFGIKPKNEYSIDGGRHYRLKFQSSFEMLIIHRFIAKNILNIVSNDYWNSGIYFKHSGSNTFALVETNQYSKVIDCWIKGENIRGMWEVIRNDFREIFSMYYNFPVDEEVEYTSEGRTVFLKYNDMIKALGNGIQIIPYDTSTGLKNIDVLFVLELFESKDQTTRAIDKEQLKIEFSPNITVNPQFNNNPAITVGQHSSEPQKTSSTSAFDKYAEDIKVRKWRNKSLFAFFISVVLTTLLVLTWINKWIFSADTWTLIEQYDGVKWVGLVMAAIWNGFIIKSLYDRFQDPSKEKAYRERLRK
jgi:internalin A